MKIRFTCSKCGHLEELRVLAVGWKKLSHRCASCGTRSVHRLSQPASVGLIFIGAMACWGIALTGRAAFDLSVDTSLLIFLATAFAMTLFLGGKVIDACSSWHIQDEGAIENEAN
jgi:uncharacterized protein (DUF983 family)